MPQDASGRAFNPVGRETDRTCLLGTSNKRWSGVSSACGQRSPFCGVRFERSCKHIPNHLQGGVLAPPLPGTGLTCSGNQIHLRAIALNCAVSVSRCDLTHFCEGKSDDGYRSDWHVCRCGLGVGSSGASGAASLPP